MSLSIELELYHYMELQSDHFFLNGKTGLKGPGECFIKTTSAHNYRKAPRKEEKYNPHPHKCKKDPGIE
jgi:hypothetical protein